MKYVELKERYGKRGEVRYVKCALKAPYLFSKEKQELEPLSKTLEGLVRESGGRGYEVEDDPA